MTNLSRAPWRALLTLATLSAITLSGCGGTTTKTSSSADSPSTSSSSASPSASGSPEASSDDAQVIEVEKYGVAFELPKGWITIDAKEALKGGGDNPVLAELADRLGMSQDQLVQTFANAVQTMSVSDEGAVHGFLDNVNTLGQESEINDEQLKLQLATLGAKPGVIEHSTSAAGEVTRVPYALSTKTGQTLRAVAMSVRTDDATVVITVSSSSESRAAVLADQIEESLRPLPGGRPNL